MPADDVAVRISRKLYSEIEKRVKESQGEFRDVRDYVEFVLSEVVKEDEKAEAPYTPEEEEQIKRRLKRWDTSRNDRSIKQVLWQISQGSEPLLGIV